MSAARALLCCARRAIGAEMKSLCVRLRAADVEHFLSTCQEKYINNLCGGKEAEKTKDKTGDARLENVAMARGVVLRKTRMATSPRFRCIIILLCSTVSRTGEGKDNQGNKELFSRPRW